MTSGCCSSGGAALGGRWIDLAALVVGALDEDRGDGAGTRPAVALGVLVENIAILPRRGQQLDVIEP